MHKLKLISIAAICITALIFIGEVAGYFIFRKRVKGKKTAVKLLRQRKKDIMWWSFVWAAWLLIGFLEWNGARQMNDRYHMRYLGLLFIAGMIITILLLLDFTVGKYAYITTQRVYFPDNFGLARNKKKVSYSISGSTLSLWFNNSIMPKKFTITEKHDELAALLKENYKLNRNV